MFIFSNAAIELFRSIPVLTRSPVRSRYQSKGYVYGTEDVAESGVVDGSLGGSASQAQAQGPSGLVCPAGPQGLRGFRGSQGLPGIPAPIIPCSTGLLPEPLPCGDQLPVPSIQAVSKAGAQASSISGLSGGISAASAEAAGLILGWVASNSPGQNQKDYDGVLATNMQETVSNFAEFYSSVGEDHNNTIKNKQTAMKFNKITTCNSFFLEERHEAEIISTILSLTNKKSPGTDGIRAEALKIIAQQTAKPVCYLTNRCFREGYVPTAFKLSSVTPIYKGGDKLHLSNYRPISLVSSLSKVFEKTLRNRIVIYIETNKILSETQLVFTKGE
nr:unnamed protein product [Callosobruchus analis]